MKQRYFTLSASIALALSSASGATLAHSNLSPGPDSLSLGETPRIASVVNNGELATLANTHLTFVSKFSKSAAQLPDTDVMQHLQLILNPSAKRKAGLEALIASQHDPSSANFRRWLTPAEYGNAFGVVDSDINALTSWLVSQGFKVNTVYLNKTQIDFSGTVAQINRSFHTREIVYTSGSGTHFANAVDISLPAVFKDVIAGVMGLNDYHAEALHKKSATAHWDKSKNSFVLTNDAAPPPSKGQAISAAKGVRALVPNDLATIYDTKALRANGVTGSGVTIAVVEDNPMKAADWTNFTEVFNLTQYGGTFSQISPNLDGESNCQMPSLLGTFGDDPEALLDAEWATAIAPGAHVEVAVCADTIGFGTPSTANFFGGVFLAASNLINSPSDSTRPNIISASYGYGEFFTDTTSKLAIDQMWAQADAEGISVFVAAGDSGSNPSFNGIVINNEYYGNTAVDANSLATSPHVTAVGGTDLADVLDGTTEKYFAPIPSVVGGSALSYVPEIPWNESCGNGVAAKAQGFNSAVAFCQWKLAFDPSGIYFTSEAGSGGPSSTDAKPAWQSEVFNAANDKSRDIPDVSLFAGSFGDHTWVIVCDLFSPCASDFSTRIDLSGGTSLASPMFAGIQALMDQGLAARGLTLNQGNAAPTLYRLAEDEYGKAGTPNSSGLASCNANNGPDKSGNCVFHNVTRGSNSTQCEALDTLPIPNCYVYGRYSSYQVNVGLTTSTETPTSYGVNNKAFGAQPGWSFTSGLGSVDARNLLIAWRAFAGVSTVSAKSATK